MNPFERWLPMYGPDAHPTRPWWHRDHSQRADSAAYYPPRWRRADGLAGPTLDGLDIEARIAETDSGSPLPPPPPMPGQVWCYPHGERTSAGDGGMIDIPNGGEVQIITVFHQMAVCVVGDGSRYPPIPRFACTQAAHYDRAILVAGPTPWGRDVPWAGPWWAP